MTAIFYLIAAVLALAAAGFCYEIHLARSRLRREEEADRRLLEQQRQQAWRDPEAVDRDGQHHHGGFVRCYVEGRPVYARTKYPDRPETGLYAAFDARECVGVASNGMLLFDVED